MQVINMVNNHKKILMWYGKTTFTPGSYLERAFNSIGVPVDVYTKEIDFNKINMNDYSAVIFVESPSKQPVLVKNIRLVNVPKLFWIHHGSNRLKENVELCNNYKPDIILMSHSLQLAKKFPAPIRFFPFAMDTNIFNSSKPLINRDVDVSFGGNLQKSYSSRNQVLKKLQSKFKNRYKLSLFSKLYLEELANLYINSKIVFNYSPTKFNTINMRIFEGIGCGALVLTNEVPFQNRLFKNGEHYVVFNHVDDLYRKINYYLKNLEEAQKIATSGHNFLMDYHTYEHRANEVLCIIKELREGIKIEL
jgi:hypothetical protein